MKQNTDPDRNKAVGSCCAQVGGYLVMDPFTRNVKCQDHKPTADECDDIHVYSPACWREVPDGSGRPPLAPQLADPNLPTLTTTP